ncbi:glutamate 5-kinase [Actinomycetota bacterium]|nr:glutamate 5-kinase [Actinomycetota bacterium]
MSSNVNRLVIKIGSSTLTDATGLLDVYYLQTLAYQVANLHKRGIEVVIVTSAAIVAGLEALDMPTTRPDDIPTLQAVAAVGQLKLVEQYSNAFNKHNIKLAQVLLTRNDTDNQESYLHIRDTLQRLLELGIVPLINENDTVAIDEIRFGDNDTLAARVAILIDADLVILLSDIDGLYTADPHLDQDAKLLEHIEEFTPEIINAAGDAGSKKGSGGMITKLEAAKMLMENNIPMVICEGHTANAIIKAANGDNIGSRFFAEERADRL